MEQIHYYTAAATRELDRLTIEEYNIPGFELMSRAGKAAFDALLQSWPNVKEVIILCGCGNNGGDGFIIAGLAKKAGLKVNLFIAGNMSSIKGDALKALKYALKLGLTVSTASEFSTSDAINNQKNQEVVLVDALLGTGLSGNVKKPFADLISTINNNNLSVLAVDIPSGLCSDTGKVLGSAVKADLTITFIARKIGLVLGTGKELVGSLLFNDLNVPDAVYQKVPFAK